MKQKLNGIPETMLIPLWAKARETHNQNPIIKDARAMEIIAGIDYDFSVFEKSWLTQVGVAIRTLILDEAVESFLKQNRNAAVINWGAGLDTRSGRLTNRDYHCWYDLDVPEAIELRKNFFQEDDKHRFIPKSIFDLSWLQDVDVVDRPVLIIAEGLLMYFSEHELKQLFRNVMDKLGNAEMLLELLAPFLVGRSNRHESLKKIDSKIEFKWGPKRADAMEGWSQGVKILQEWNYYDYYHERWKWFGVLGRLPFLRQRLSNRIVRLSLTRPI